MKRQGMLRIISFLPFAGREVNGSTTVATQLMAQLRAAGIPANHVTLPTAWTSAEYMRGHLHGSRAVIGLGEGWPYYTTVERFAFRDASGKDEHGSLPTGVNTWPTGAEIIESHLQWNERWLPGRLKRRLQLPCSAPVIRGTMGGSYLCNALHYHILALGLPGGFCHLPPQEEWLERTGQDAHAYAKVFADLVQLILKRNCLI